MEFRNAFNKNAKPISLLGFGGWQLGNKENWEGPGIEDGISLVKEAYEKGINFFDTAPNYGNGDSEIIIGKALKDVRKNVIINTKIGHGPNGENEFTPDGIRNSIKRSLKKLQTKYIDSVILHNPESYVLEGKSNLFDVLESEKNEGRIRHYGVSIDSLEELKTALKLKGIETIEIMFNIIHQEPKFVFDLVKKRKILLIIKVPLDSGWLTGKYNELSEFKGIRSRWDKETIEVRAHIVEKIKSIVNEDNLVGPALAFIKSFEAVTTIIPGVKNTQQLNDNIRNIDYDLTEKQIFELEKLYEDYIKHQNTPW